MQILSGLKSMSTVQGRQQLVDIVADQADLDKPFRVYAPTVEPVLKDCRLARKKYGLSSQVVFGDKFCCTGMLDFLPWVCGPSRQVVFHGSGLSRQALLYF